MPRPKFTENEYRILALAGDNLGHSDAPFKEIADAVGVEEAEVLSLLQGLKKHG